MHRAWAIIEREMRRFRRSPMVIVMSMIMPLAQLLVLGYAFGGNVKHLKLAIVDQDHGTPAVRVRELANLAFLDRATNVLFIGGLASARRIWPSAWD
jgi:ABC-2 type transport system permease protein